jgi:ABC-type Fe3+ transport system substrate-binding protein
MPRRAEALASRIEQGAANLIAFAETLNDDEWRTIVAPDGRTVGVIVHHVGFVYPIEIDLTRLLAEGKPMPATWADVAQLNAKHAKDHANVTKRDAIDLIRDNSKAAAEAVRGFTDEQLDNSNTGAMYANAPITAQFFIEDHPVRHSWHHLAKLRACLGKVEVV